ncbi:hypothetical protein AURDEDRAFT_76251 [Auricularia subglabra TFB-10046 SS5]|nr:hypothetical protein AURDEDRAFT_76251 [Auricularia subglabra TFB-10046 SS5]
MKVLIGPCSLKLHLEPLAIAANATQSDCARLDVVGVMAANLRYYFATTLGLDRRAADAAIESLERRWAKVDQDIFILAIILNPFIRTSCFADGSPFRVPMLVVQLAEAAFQRFYDVTPCADFRAQLIDYLTSRGSWTADAMGLKTEKRRAKEAGIEVNLLHLWRLWSPINDGSDSTGIPKDGTGQLALLATRILSMIPNSASVERVFSIFGIVHSKHRNRLSKDKVRKIVQVRLNTLSQFAKRGGSRKRTFGELLDDTDDGTDDEESLPPSQESGQAANGELSAELGGAEQAMQDEQARAIDVDFEVLAQEMMDEAGLQADGDDGDVLPPRLDAIPADARCLKNLFKYPAEGDTSSRQYKILTHYWRLGQRNLQREVEHQQEMYEHSRRRAQ